MQNNSILDALSTRVQFVVYRVFPQLDGKLDKIPVSPYTGHRIDGQDRQNWMLPYEALLYAEALGDGHGVGLVIYEGCGLACIDFDHCREPSGGWQPHVPAFTAWFPGAATETSYSGTGRHVLLSYRVGVIPAHSTKNKTYRMEVYTKSRFIALTGIDAQGNVLSDHTVAFARFLTDYFPPRTAADDRDGTWTDTPVEEWHGPDDDTELLQRALRSAGIKARLGAKAAFADLWSAQPEVLSRAYPSSTGRSWDGSSADQALANHLAFWTGNDCERMLRIMRGSELRRDKWDRPDYLQRTIIEACSKQTEWYSDPNLAQTPRGQEVGTTGPLSIPPATPNSDQSVPQPPTNVVPAPPSQAVTLLHGLRGHEVAQGAPVQSLAVIVPAPPYTQGEPTERPVTQPAAGSVALTPGVDVPAQVLPATPVVTVPVPPPTLALPKLKPGQLPPPSTYLTISMMKQVFDGYAYVTELNQIQLPNGSTLPKDRFDVVYGGRQWSMTADGQRPGKSAWDAFTANELYDFPRVSLQCFRPGRPTNEITERDGLLEINCYRPANVRRAQGDPAPLIIHLQKLLPDDWELMLYTMAARVQNVGTKFMWHPYLQGCKGNGKTMLGKILEYAIGELHTHWPKSDQIDEKFNNVFSNKVLLIVDELPKNGYDIEPVLNTLSTATRLEVRPMYGEKVMKNVCFNILFISNYQGSLQCDPDQRRYAPFFCAQQNKKDLARDGLTPAYFIELRRWLEADGYAICAEYLNTLQVPKQYTPSQAVRAPDTSATYAANVASRGAAEQELHHAIEQQLDGFRAGWISSNAVDMLLARVGKDKVIPRNAREALIESCGYIRQPSLPEGLCTVALADGSRPRLYVSEGHPWAVDYLTAQQVRDGYLESQKR